MDSLWFEIVTCSEKIIAECPDLYCPFGREVEVLGIELCECRPDPCEVSLIYVL